jgi:4-amino-4-deoxy-L-arabinose transferase-like glycosyltransferase
VPETTPTPPPVWRREAVSVAVVTAAFGLLLTLWAVMTPMFQAPDEFTHWDASVRVALDKGWPPPGEALNIAAAQAAQVTNFTIPPADRPTFGALQQQAPGYHDFVNQMTQHPPTYYLLAGTVLDTIDFTQHRWDAGVLALRLLDVVLVAPLPLLTWATVRRLTRSPRTALVAATALFAVPQLAQIGASVTNDAPVILLGGVVVWLTTRVLTGDRTWRTTLVLGAALGLMLAVKGTAFPAVPFVALAVLLGGTSTVPLRTRLLQTLGTGVVTAALGAWWWIGNLVRYGTIQPNGLADERPPTPWPAGEGPNAGLFLNTFWDGVTSSFWGQFGRAQYPVSPVVSDVLTVGALLLVGVFAYRASGTRRAALLLTVLPVVIAVSMLANGWNTYDETQGVYGTQGRYFYPSLVALVALSAIAATALLAPGAPRRRAAVAVAVSAPLLALYGLSVAYRGFFEGFDLAVTGQGLRDLAGSLPVGRPEFVVLALATLAGLVAVAVLTARAGDRPELTTYDAAVPPARPVETSRHP